MTEKLQDMSSTLNRKVEAAVDPAATSTVEVEPAQLEVSPSAVELDVAREMVRSARARGVALTGQGGMLQALTKTVIETALDEEMAEHLGYDCADVPVPPRGVA